MAQSARNVVVAVIAVSVLLVLFRIHAVLGVAALGILACVALTRGAVTGSR